MSLQKMLTGTKGNQGRGEIRARYGSESKRINQLLPSRVERIDSPMAKYAMYGNITDKSVSLKISNRIASLNASGKWSIPTMIGFSVKGGNL